MDGWWNLKLLPPTMFLNMYSNFNKSYMMYLKKNNPNKLPKLTLWVFDCCMDGNGNGHKNILGWMHNWMGSPNFDSCMNGI